MSSACYARAYVVAHRRQYTVAMDYVYNVLAPTGSRYAMTQYYYVSWVSTSGGFSISTVMLRSTYTT